MDSYLHGPMVPNMLTIVGCRLLLQIKITLHVLVKRLYEINH